MKRFQKCLNKICLSRSLGTEWNLHLKGRQLVRFSDNFLQHLRTSFSSPKTKKNYKNVRKRDMHPSSVAVSNNVSAVKQVSTVFSAC